MSTVSASEVREKFAEFVNRAGYGHERFVLTRHGKPCAALVPAEDLELIEMIEDVVDIEAAREALKEAGEARDWEDVKKELGL